ncbi:MAG: N-acetylmuramoyl-L-alanine amidase [Thermodesulfobacteriota bacterium]|nr:N-acetylmuramoyl-L-alanine amidase [Thermodesulfobacteriota bacterium]
MMINIRLNSYLCSRMRFHTNGLNGLKICLVLSLFCFTALYPSVSPCSSGKQRYFAADNCYKRLKNSSVKQKYRENWMKCIDKYQAVFTKNPSGPWAAAGMYRAAQLYLELYKISFRIQDRIEAVDLLRRIQKRYPSSVYSDRSRHLIRKIEEKSSKTTEKKITRYTGCTKVIKPEPDLKSKPDDLKTAQIPKEKSRPEDRDVHEEPTPAQKSIGDDSIITGLRFWSNPNYTRVVVDATHESDFTHRLLKKDPSIHQPQRLYVDLDNSRISRDLPRRTAINDDLLLQARAGQHTPHSVRVVVDIKSFDNYKIFSLKDPFRLVIDVWGEQKEDQASQKTARLSTDNIKSSAIAKQFALGVRKIVIDPGHGGKDPGAPGYLKGVWEKDVILKLSKTLAQRMRDRLKCEVVLTRSTDTYLTLEERTAIANTKNADLFISMHCNAARNRKLAGIETYYLNLATDDQAISVAARENATSRKNISDLDSILNDLMKNAKINESSRLAAIVQSTMVKHMKLDYSDIRDLGVKQAPFYVLLGARMPSILIETSFLSNKTECKRLISSRYQTKICDAIISGVEKYIKETNPLKL